MRLVPCLTFSVLYLDLMRAVSCARHRVGSNSFNAWASMDQEFCPGYNQLWNKLLWDARQAVDADLKLYWEEAKYTCVVLMSDEWTDATQRLLINVLHQPPRARSSVLQRIARATLISTDYC